MNRPPLLVRVAGSPLPAFLLFLGYAAIIAGWYEGTVVWWLALAAVGASLRTLSAVGRVRRYKAWLAEWNAMDTKEQQRPKDKPSRRWMFVTSAVLLLLVIPAYCQHLQGNEGLRTALMLLWVVAGIYLVGLLLRRITRGMTKLRKAQPESATAPVEWMLGRPFSSPSRSEAARKLPEYCTRLLGS
jgi:hypothetical protein